MKQAVIAPSMLYLLYPLNESVEGYSRDQFNEDLVNEVRRCFSCFSAKAFLNADYSAKKTSGDASRRGRKEFLLILRKVSC